MWNASSGKLCWCFWQVWPCPLCWASESPSTMRCLHVSSFGTEGFPFDSCGPASPVKVCSALGAKVKETSAIRWINRESRVKHSFSYGITVSPSLQFCNQCTELRNGSLGGGAGPMNLRLFHSANFKDPSRTVEPNEHFESPKWNKDEQRLQIVVRASTL